MSSIAALLKRIGTLPAIAVVLLLVAPMSAEARVGGGGSIGSRGFKTWVKPPSTNTAPKAAQPMDRSITPQPGKPTAGPAATAATAQPRPSMSFGKLLMGGLIAGALASVFGFGAFASILGFLLQVALIGGIIWLAMTWWRSRNGLQTASASAGSGAARSAYQASDYARQSTGYGASTQILTIAKADYDAFERLLSEIQSAFGRGDLKALEARTTPEMYAYLAGDLAENTKRGVRNELSGTKLLQGDLAEAWREGNQDYATVAMRFSLLDATIDVRSGRVVEGSRSAPQEVTEIWTFVRPRNGSADQWELSAIQQTSA